MPAYFEQGFMVREPAWHGLGIVLDEYPGRDEAKRLAGHDFRILERQIQTVPYDESGQRHNPIVLPKHKALLNDKTNEPLGVVGIDYGVVQNDTLWDIVDAMANEPDVHYETAGILNGGAVLWVLVRLTEPIQVPGDNSLIHRYVQASTTHDGSGACRADSLDVRTVCWNTYQQGIGHAEAAGTSYVFRHTKSVMDRVDEARKAIRGARETRQSFLELAEALIEVRFTPEGIRDWLSTFIPEPPAAVQTKRSRTFIDKARGQVMSYLHSPSVPDIHKRNGYGLFLAGTEYLDHGRSSHNPETYFRRTVRPEPAKTQLAKLILAS